MFFPVTFLGMYSPFAIRLLLRSAQSSGMVSGTVYGVSTGGSIVGTLGTTFFLIPAIGSRAITLLLGVAGVSCGMLLFALPRFERRHLPTVALALGLVFILAAPAARADTLVDEGVRAAMLKRPDGQIAHIESEYAFATSASNVGSSPASSFSRSRWGGIVSTNNFRAGVAPMRSLIRG